MSSINTYTPHTYLTHTSHIPHTYLTHTSHKLQIPHIHHIPHTNFTHLTHLTYLTYLTYLTHLTQLTHLTRLPSSPPARANTQRDIDDVTSRIERPDPREIRRTRESRVGPLLMRTSDLSNSGKR